MVRHSERLGNLVILGLAIDILKKAMPKLSIDVLAPENYKYVLEINQSVNNVIALNKKDFFRYPWTFIALLGQIRKGRYDLAIDCSDNISRSASARFYTIMAAAKTTAGYDKMAKPLYAIPVSPEISYDHAVEMYLRLFEQVFGVKLQLTDSLIPTPAIDLSLPVLLNVGGRGKKIWPIEEFIKVAMLLEKMKVDYKFLLGPNESELARSLINQFGENSKRHPD
jgi:ADP-heptose:LPS heptosyltransferase